MTATEGPDDALLPQQKHPRHLAHVAVGSSGEMPLQKGLHPPPDDPGVQERAAAAQGETESVIDGALLVGDCPSLRPVAVEEDAAGCR